MVRMVVVLVAALALVPSCSRKGDTGGRAPSASEAAAQAPDSATGAPAAGASDEVVDPFCGVRLKKGEAAASTTYDGVTYWFCLADHRDAFLANPEKALCRLGLADAGTDCGHD